MSAFDFTIAAEEGATYTPFTDGWAVGFKVSAPGRPDRWIYLNPSQSDDLGESNVFVYNDAHEPTAEEPPVGSVCYVLVWGDDESGPPGPASAGSIREATP